MIQPRQAITALTVRPPCWSGSPRMRATSRRPPRRFPVTCRPTASARPGPTSSSATRRLGSRPGATARGCRPSRPGRQGCAPVPMYQHEFDAYVSLTYNIGASAFVPRP